MEKETRKRRIREIHGLLATKMQAGPQPYGMVIEVRDDVGMVRLNIGQATYSAGLTPDEARMLAKQLMDAAGRCES